MYKDVSRVELQFCNPHFDFRILILPIRSLFFCKTIDFDRPIYRYC